MGGVINYYHGESGLIMDRQLVVTKDQRAHTLRLRYNPHREFAFDYEGGDIHIDPLLKVGDTATFVRLEPYGGIWVRNQDQLYPDLQSAYDRVTEEIRARPHPPGVITVRLQGIWTEQYIADEVRSASGNPSPTQPATKASFFLSFSSKNVLLARQIFSDLRHDAKVDLWFDLDQAGESPEHRRRIERWLREAVYESRGFILLWTGAAKTSSWVSKEISWALEKASRDPDFHFVVLKLDDEPVPANLLGSRHLVDCYDLWPVHGINEELFAAVTNRSGRSAWIERHRRRGLELFVKDEGSNGYEPFRSDSGIAISLRHWQEDDQFHWRLDYEKDRRLHRVFGHGEEQAVDLGIRPGDHVGFFVCHRSPLCRFWPGVPVWMRSDNLHVRPEDVLVTYWHNSGGEMTPNRDLKNSLMRSGGTLLKDARV